MKKFPRIVFIGGTHFSLFSLKELFMNQYNIVGIITNPDDSLKRRKKDSFTNRINPIKKYALENHIPFLQPKNLLDSFFFKI